MNRIALLLATVGVIAMTATTEAGPRGWGGGNGYRNGGGNFGRGGYGNGYGGYGNGYSGYGNGYGGYGNGYGGYGNGYGGYGNGYGIYGSGIGIGIGGYNGYSPYYGGGYSSGYTPDYIGNSYNSYSVPSNWYSTSPWTSRTMTTGDTQRGVIPANYTEIARDSHWGLRIEEMTTGGAAQKADLRKGDVIIGIGKTRTDTFEELQQALAAAKGTVDLTFHNADSQRLEKVRITPDHGKIGVSVVAVD